MIVDARTLPENKVIETDVCIVGAGTAGITITRELIGQQFRVCLLESGGLEPDKETHGLYEGENVGLPYFTLDTARARYFGGSSNRWHISIGNNQLGARIRPLDEIDFEKRDWVPYSGWPFKKKDLETYYNQAQSICETEPISYDLTDWEDGNKNRHLPLNDNRVQTIIYKFCSKDIFVNKYAQEVSQSENVSTYLHANVIDIETDGFAGNVVNLHVACLDGNKFRVSAKYYVLAAGGIEIPRLLLLSNKRQQCGLGNQNDLVGRFFMEHLHFWSGIFIPSDPEIFKKTNLYNEIQTINNVPIIGKLAISEKLMRSEKLINHNIQLIPRTVLNPHLYPYIMPENRSDAISSLKMIISSIRKFQMPSEARRHLINLVAGFDDICKTTYLRLRKKVGHLIDKKRVNIYILANMAEQIPNPNSRVTLGQECDQLGLNLAKLDWQITASDILNSIRVQKIIGKEIRRAGLGRLYTNLRDDTPPSNLHGGYHHMGTTRMHNDPRQGVVDDNCKVHGISNLFIAGPSVFPTGGYANPVLTIVALTLRLADHMKKLMN